MNPRLPAKQLSILIVDDEPAITQVLCEFFGESLSCETAWARNGNDAVQMLQTGCYNLIVTDVNHPGVDGLELARFAKEQIGTNVIVLTGYRDTKPEDAQAAGADALF